MIFNSPTLARIKGIDVRMHWSLPVLMILQLWGTDNLTDAFHIALLFAGLLLGVTLHELGHCVVARRKGLEVRDILLTPIGGIAFVAGPVHSPRDEMQIAIAGPLVSFALAIPGALLFAGSLFVGFPEAALLPLIVLLIPNLSLGVFNLLPAFPMDGGRVLRAVLTEKRGAVEATRIAAKIGQGLATLLFLAGLFTLTFSLIFIGLFVLFIASRELAMVRLREWTGADDGALRGDETVVGPPPYASAAPARTWGRDFTEVLRILARDLFTGSDPHTT